MLLGRGGYTSCCRWAIGRGVLRCLGAHGGAVRGRYCKGTRRSAVLRHCWAVGATGWVTNNLLINTLLARVHQDLPCTSCIASDFLGVKYGSHLVPAGSMGGSRASTPSSSPTKTQCPLCLLQRSLRGGLALFTPSYQRQTFLTAIILPTILLEARQQSTRFYGWLTCL